MQDGQRFGDSSFEYTMVCVTCVSNFLVYGKMLVIQLPYVKITNQRTFMHFSVLFYAIFLKRKLRYNFFPKNYEEKKISVVLLVFLYVVFIVDIKL